ncbi:MAG: ABC transporter substrate-binding protein, partial [Hyphomicrobiales bacterium]
MKRFLTGLTVTASLMSNTALAEDADAVAFRDAFLAGTATWEDVEVRAKEEGTVNLYYWGGSDPINIWI